MTHAPDPPLGRAACIGAGVIGAGWVARVRLAGVDVAVHDPAAQAPRILDEVMANAARAYDRLVGARRPAPGELVVAASVAEAVDGADLIQESVPERLELKRAVLAEIDAAAAPDALIGSSTSGLLPTDMQAGLRRPGRVVVAHPFNPVYLLPLVEVVAGRETEPAAVERAREIYAWLGMKPVVIAREIDAFVGDRLQEALWREALWLVNDGIADVEAIDDVIRYSFGLRWAQMGVFQTYRIAGGEGGMRHFMAQFGPALAWPWTRLTDVPELTDALLDRIAGQSDAQAGGLGVRELERIRDDNLVDILGALERARGGRGWGAGVLARTLAESLAARAPAPPPALELHTAVVDADWVDYNGHMTEHRYVQVCGEATDALLDAAGAGLDYVAAGHSFYTVENRMRYLAEAHAGDRLVVATEIVEVAEKRVRVVHRLRDGAAGTELATSEQVLVHVDTGASRSCPAPAAIVAAFQALGAGTSPLAPAPGAAGPLSG